MRILCLLLMTVTLGTAQPTLLLEENFAGNNRYWPLAEKQVVADGVLLFNAPEDGDQSWISLFIDPSKDYIITADFVQKSGLADGGFGLVWGSDEINYNVF